MTSASSQLVQKPAPEMVEIKNIFFKAHPTLNYFADEAQAEAVDNEEAFKNCNRALECSNKYGCLLLSFNESLYLLRVSDVVSEGGNLQFEAVKKLKIVNAAMPVAPNIIALSNGEDFLAVDTVRLNHEAFVLVFDFAEFIKTAGTCRPICEIRCSATSRVRGVGWNPGENMNGIIAINTNEGALYMAKINGPNNVEFNKFAESDVRSLCWSPRGKQLVVGRTNGTLTQLKVELTMAKNIPAPEPGCLPVAIQWTQTTQFLVLYQRRDEGRSELMQIDVVKGATPTYRNSGDIFIQDIYHEMTSCYFLPLTQWNTILAMVNCATDIVVLVKKTEDNQEVWAPADIADNRRAAFLLDNYARGVALFNGSEKRVTFSEVESYNPMPMLFLLSQRGSLSIYSIVNDDPNAASLQVKVSGSVPDSIFSVVPPASQQKPQLSTQPRQVSQVQPTAPNPPQLVQQPVQVASSITPKPASPFSFGGGPGQKPLFQVPSSQQTATQPPPTSLFQSSSSLFKANPISSQPVSAAAAFPQTQHQAPLQQQPQQMKPAILSGGGDASVQQQNQQLQKPDIRQLGTSTLSASLDFEGLQKAVEEKRRGMTTQLQNSGSGAVAAIRNLDNDDQCGFVVEEVQKFEERLANFKEGMLRNRNTLHNLLKACNTSLEKSVLTTLNSVEDFTTDMVSITNSQKEEVEVLKERILNHFSQLEYAKSLVERSRDPRYIEHLRSRPLDPASQQRFEEICKFHNYIKNQLSECRRYYYDQHRKRDKPLDRAPNTQLIYMTLSNHSKIIRRLKAELDNIKERLGLGKHSGVIDEAEFLAVCEASYSGQKKESNNNTNGHNEDQEEISLNDLTSGISKVKLNRDSSRPDKKPIQFSNRKLLILRKSMTEVSVVKVKAEESAWTRIPSKPTRPSVQAQATSATIQQPSETTQVKFQQQSSMTPSVFESSPTINKTDGVASQFQTQQQPNFARAPPPSASSFVASPKSGVSSPTTASITPGVPGTSTPIGSPFAPKQNTVISSTTQKATPQSTTANYFNAPKDTSAASPTVQNPTLAGLLASPSTLPSTPKPTPGTVSSGLPTMSIDFSSAFGAASGGKSLFSSEVLSSGSKQEDKQQSNISTTSNKPAILQEKPPTNSSTLVATPTAPKSSTVVAKPSAPESLHTAKPVTPASSTEVSKPPSSMFSFTAAATPPAASNITGTTDMTKTQPVPFSFSTPSTTKSAILSTKTTTTSSGLFLSPITSTTGKTGLSFGFASGLNLTTSSSKGPGLFGTPPAATTAAEAIGVKIPPGITITTTNVSATSTTIPAAVAPTAVSSAPLLQKALETSAVSNTASTPPTATTISKTAEVAPGTSTVASITSGSFSFSGSPAISSITPASGTPTSATSITGGLFTSPSTPATIAATSATGIFGSGGAISFTSPTTGMFGSPTTATTAGTTPGIFGSSTTTATTAGGTPGIFGSTTTPTSATPSLFGTPTSQVTATTATTGLFSSISTTPVATSGSTPAPTAPAGFFTQITTTPATAPISNFMSSLGIGTSPSTATPSSTAGGGLFSSSPFGSSTTSAAPAANIFGGGTSTFGTQPATTAQQNVFGGGIFGGAAAKTTSSSNVFGASSPPTASVFGGAGATPSFGSSPSSPFGSSFGGSTAPAFGGGSVFGSTTAATSASQPSGFGTTSATTAFGGGSVFGSGGGGTFGSPAAASVSTGLFSSTFGGSSTTSTTSAGGIFGATFGSGTPATGGAFSAGGGGVGQQGFGFGQTKPTTTGSLFGTTPTAAPVFGGGATFGSTSPFGASFSASPQQQTTTFGSAAAAGGSVFGGSAGSQALGFGALAQGGGGGGGFGNTFGSTSPQQQQQSPPFGSSPQPPQSSSFTSWR